MEAMVRPKRWSPAWHYIRMLELGMQTLFQLEQYSPVDKDDKDAVTTAINYMKHQKSSTRGGSRAGAGRKRDPNAKVSTTIRLSRDIKEYLATTDDATATIETTIRNSKAYKQWKRK